MRSGNQMGFAKSSGQSLEIMSGFDYDEDISAGTDAVDLDSTTVITLTNEPRNRYYCRGFHNPTSTAVTIKYTSFNQTAATLKTCYIPAGGQYFSYTNIKTVGGAGSATTTLKLYWKDRTVVDGNGPRDIV